MVPEKSFFQTIPSKGPTSLWRSNETFSALRSSLSHADARKPRIDKIFFFGRARLWILPFNMPSSKRARGHSNRHEDPELPERREVYPDALRKTALSMTWHSSPGLSLFFAVCCLISYRGSIDQVEKDALTETAFRRQLQSDFAASDVPPAVDFRWNMDRGS